MPWQDALEYLPSNAGAAFTTVVDSTSHLDPSTGIAVLAAWVLGFLVLAIVLVRQRDV